MSEDGATENPQGRVTLECEATLTAVSCHHVAPSIPPQLTVASSAAKNCNFLHFWSFFQKMLQLLSLNRGVLIALHLTFAQNSYCGCEFCIFLYSIICNKLSISHSGTEKVQLSPLLNFCPSFTLLASHPLLPCIRVISCRSASDSHCRPFLPSPGNCCCSCVRLWENSSSFS